MPLRSCLDEAVCHGFECWDESVKEELEPPQEEPRRSVASRPVTSIGEINSHGRRQSAEA